MSFSTPPTAVNGAAISSQHVNTLRDNDNWFNGLLGSPMQVGQVPISTSTSAATYGLLGAASIVDGAIGATQLADQAIGTAQTADGNVDSTALASAVVALLLVSGLGGWFRTAAEIPSGWARETDGDGRFFVGAGTTFSTTFVEETNYGSAWSHTHSLGGTPSIEPSTGLNYLAWSLGAMDPSTRRSAAQTGHTHSVSGSITSTSWTIPSRGYVAARRA